MSNMSNKAQLFSVLTKAIIAMFVVAVLIIVFQKLFFKQAGGVDQTMDNTNDLDGDGVMDMFDMCCNTPLGVDPGANGCTKTECHYSCGDRRAGKEYKCEQEQEEQA